MDGERLNVIESRPVDFLWYLAGSSIESYEDTFAG